MRRLRGAGGGSTAVARAGLGLALVAWGLAPTPARAQAKPSKVANQPEAIEEVDGTANSSAPQETDAETSPESPAYPFGPLRLPCSLAPCGKFRLVDLALLPTIEDGFKPSTSARVRIGNTAIVGARAGQAGNGFELRTSRLDFSYLERDGRHRLDTVYRGSRVRLDTSAVRRPTALEGGWVLDGAAALRLGPDFEVIVGGLYDLDGDSSPLLATRPTRVRRVRVLWQRRNNLQLSAAAVASQFLTTGGEQLDSSAYSGAVTFQARRLQLRAEVGHEHINGRFGRREWLAVLGGNFLVGSRLLLEGETLNCWEIGLKKTERDYRVSATLFGRDYRFARTSPTARRTRSITDRAWELGYNERRPFTLDGRRALRERLSLSAHRDELGADVESMYRSTIAERNVPLVRAEFARETEPIDGSIVRTYGATIGIPWRGGFATPWSHDERFVDFVRLSFERVEADFTPNLKRSARSLGVTLDLDRETQIVARWTEPLLDPLIVVLSTRTHQRFELGLRYSFWR